jgi:RHS repeat-associated protein
MGGRRFRVAVVALLCSVAGCADDVLYGGGSGGAGGAGLGGESLGDFDSDRPPSAIVDGFDVTIEKIAGGDVEISWTSQGVSTYEVWTSSDPYFVPGEPGSTMEQSSSALSFVDDMGGEGYYRVVAEGAAEELSTTVGQRTSTLYRFYTKLGLCLVSDVDTWPELDADMPSNPSSASLWIASNQSWRVPPALNTTVFGPGEVIAVQHLQNPAPSPNTYTEIGYVPTESDVSIPLYVGDNLVTTVPYRFGPIMASELLEQVENATRIGRWDASTQTLDWHPEDGDWEIPPCSAVHVEVDAASTWPPPAPPEDPLPPDPSEVAPPLDTTVTTRFVTQVSFLYDAEEPIQTGVDPEDIDPARVAVLRGQVLDEEGEPLPGVEVSVKDHPEFGATLSRADGGYDLAVNGGGWLTVELRTEGRVPAQRTIDVPWQDFAIVDDVVLVERDSAVTTIDFSDPIEVAVGSEITDADGTRQPVLLFAEDTVATMHMPGGGTEPLTAISVRMTEATLGELGPARMVADLPATSMYTYAIDFSIDEAEAAGAESVTFDPPVISYNENFIGFPVGQVVPAGSYDMARASWLPEANGVVLLVVSETGGLADLDLNGDGIAETALNYAAAGITDEERQVVAGLYAPADELWRVEVDHFSTWDCNWGANPPLDAQPPPADDPDDPQREDRQCEVPGSILGCQGQIMGERLGVVGTPFTLNYRSDRVPGRTAAYSISLPVSGATLHEDLRGARLRIEVAGRVMQQEFAAIPNQTASFTWDGLDAYGRRVQGPAQADICLGYRYPAEYTDMSAGGSSVFAFPASGVQIEGDRALAEFIFWRCYMAGAVGGGARLNPATSQAVFSQNNAYMLGVWDARTAAPALGGWTLDVHHSLSPESGFVYLGDGRRVDSRTTPLIQTVAGGGASSAMDIPAVDAVLPSPFSIAAGADGSLYIGAPDRVSRIDPSGILRHFAGQMGLPGFSGDGGPAVSAQVNTVTGIAVARDGAVFLAEAINRRIRRVDPNGTISTFAGTGSTGVGGDGGPAASATVTPDGIAAAEDGTLFVTSRHPSPSSANGDRIRRISPDGTISTFAGATTCTSGLPDGKRANEDCVFNLRTLALGPDGSVYFAANPTMATGFANIIYRIDADYRFERVAGGGNPPDGVGDGLAATDALLENVRGVSVSKAGILLIADSGGGTGPARRRIRTVGHNGIIRTLAGGNHDAVAVGACGGTGDNGPASATCIDGPNSITIGNDHAVYFSLGSSAGANRVRRLSSASLGFSVDEVLVASEDHQEIYVFDESGRHLSTRDALTGAPRRTFDYDGDGRLTAIVDVFSASTTIERDGSGQATAIISPDGQETTLVVSSGGYLQTITNAEGETHTFGYSTDGLLTSHVTPELDEFEYQYDADGRLILASDPEGGSKAFSRSSAEPGDYEVAMTTELGRESVYRVEREPNGDKHYVNTSPDENTLQTVQRLDGSTTTIYPDGTVIDLLAAPDPRFGMQAPLATVTTTTPGGRERVESWTRAVTLATPGDPLSMTGFTTTFTRNGNVWTSTWDASTDEVVVESPEGRVSTTTLNAAGQPELTQADTLAALTLSYDARGRPVLLTRGTGGTARETDVAYGTDGFVDSVTDPLDRTHAFSYDLVGRVIERTRPDSGVIGLSYDANGNLDGITPAMQPEHGFGYDATERMTSYDPPAVSGAPSPSTTYEYTLDHEIELITRPDAQEIDVAYDATTGQITSIVTPLGSYSVTYDGAGRVDVMSDPAGGTLTYAYDGPLVLSETLAGDVDGSVAWTYDDDFRIATQSVNAGPTVTFAYDDDGGMVVAGAASITLDATTGLLTDITLGDVDTALDHSEFGELSDLTYAYDSSTIFDVTYTRDALARVDSFVETIESVTREVEYGYDLAGRLETVTIDTALAATYEYDDNGNRTAVITSGTISATYDDQDRLLTFGDYEYAYTAAGELVSRTDTVTTDVTLFDYDVVGNLRSVELPDSTLIEYVTDARRRRVGKSIDGVPDRGWLYGDQLNIVAELDEEGDLVSRFVYGGAPANAPLYMVRGGATYRLVTDQLGSVRLVVDVSTGTVAQRLDYDPWGVVLTDTNPGFQPFGFAGGLYDPDTGLVRFGARDYDPEVGRWTSKDPILFNGGDENLFVYSRNDPVNYLDANGLWPALNTGKTIFGDLALAFSSLFDAYTDMKSQPDELMKNGVDKYFHCLGNCRAAMSGASLWASLLSEARELWDESIKDHDRAWCDEDRAANDHGRANEGASCRLHCAEYRPDGLPSPF